MIKEIINDYNQFIQKLNYDGDITFESYVDFMNDDYDAAMEADTNDPNSKKPVNTTNPNTTGGVGDKVDTQNVNKSETDTVKKSQEFGDRVNDILNGLADAIRDFMNKFSMLLSNLVESDKAFKEKYTHAKQNYKSTGGVKMIVYNYDLKVISNVRSHFNAYVKRQSQLFLSDAIGAKLGADTIFEIDEDEFDKKVLKDIGAPGNITNLKDYLSYLKERYRGKSSTRIIQPQEAVAYEPAALDETKIIRSILNRDKNEAYNLISKIVVRLKMVRNNSGLSDETRNRAKKYAKRIVRLEKMYNSYLDFYYHMRIERTIGARNVLKTLYGI